MILNSIAGLEELTLPPAEVHEGAADSTALHGRWQCGAIVNI